MNEEYEHVTPSDGEDYADNFKQELELWEDDNWEEQQMDLADALLGGENSYISEFTN